MYRRGDKYCTKPGRTYFFISAPGCPDGKFTKAIETYCNALINSDGGILVFGVDHSGRVVGFDLSRVTEDIYKLNFDNVIKLMRPTIHPHQYRLDVLYIHQGRALFEIRMSAGEREEIYENSRREMFIVKEKQLYGPLVPCEITQIVLAKYKEELSALIIENNQSLKQTTKDIEEKTSADETQFEQQKEKVFKESVEKKDVTNESKKHKINKVSWP